MPTFDANFRADVNRSICVFGEINDDLVSKLAPQILQLRADNHNAPITVFINSNGGAVRCMDFIYGLLNSRAAGAKKQRVITVAVGNTASSAATLLTLGDYAIAYLKSAIHFHGVRYGQAIEVTMESASTMADMLERRNRVTASTLAESGTMRLAFHYARLKNDFPEILTLPGHEQFTDIECFALSLKQKTTLNGDKIIDKAMSRWTQLQEFQNIVTEANSTNKKGLEFEAEVLHRVINHEVEKENRNQTGWKLDEDGFFKIGFDYLLLRDYHLGRHTKLTQTLFHRFKHAFFTDEENAQMDLASKSESPDHPALLLGITRMQKTILPFCYFTSSIWQCLQEDENPLTPEDAYWLGAVDEVYDTDLPCMRDVVEGQNPDQPNLPTSSSESAPPSSQSPSASPA